MFHGRRTCQLGSVGPAILNSYFICGSKKWPQKHENFEKNWKILGKYLDLFSGNFSQNFQILVKKRLILQDFAKKSAKKKL